MSWEEPPVLSIVTRVHPNRIGMLVHLGDSIRTQTDGRVQWVQIEDPGGPEGREGIARMNRELARFDAAFAGEIEGRYVYIVDDDDVLASEELVAGLAIRAETEAPEWFMVKAHLGSQFERHNKVYPLSWGEPWKPRVCHLSMLNLIVRADVFLRHRAVMSVDSGADYQLAASMFESGVRPVWWDFLAARTQRISDGLGEPNPPEVLEMSAEEFAAMAGPGVFGGEELEVAVDVDDAGVATIVDHPENEP